MAEVRINKKAVEFVINRIKSLDDKITILFNENAVNQNIYIFDLELYQQKIQIQYNRALMDDFETAIEENAKTEYFYTLENTIKFKIYIALGLEGLIQDFEVSADIINEKGRRIRNRLGYNLSFDGWIYGIFDLGLRRLSIFLGDILTNHDLDLKDIRSEKKSIDGLISYSKKYGHLSSDGVEESSLGFLKAAAVCEIIAKENERSQSGINRIKREITKDIYRIVQVLRDTPFRNAKMPECIKDYYETNKKHPTNDVRYSEDNQETKSNYKRDTDMRSIPKAFISYSWDNKAHKGWVKELAKQLRSDGVETILDQWHAIPGDQMPQFMERAIRENDFVLIVCTPHYKRKSDNRQGGVGYEGDIMTAEVFTTKNDRKFIPILREDEWSSSSPTWLSGKKYIDLRGNPYEETEYNELCSTLHGKSEEPPPVLIKKTRNKANKSSQSQKESIEKISFNIANPLLWKISNEKYTAIGKKDTFAWSEKVIGGNVIISVDIESNYEDGEGVIVVYGEGVKWSQGCLIFNIASDSQSIRAHTPYNGVEFLSESNKHIKFLDHKFAVRIEIISDKATMYVDEEKVVSTFLPNNISRKGRVGLFKYWARPEVTYSNILIT